MCENGVTTSVLGLFVIIVIFVFCLKDGAKIAFEGFKEEGLQGLKKGNNKLRSGLIIALTITAILLWSCEDGDGSKPFAITSLILGSIAFYLATKNKWNIWLLIAGIIAIYLFFISLADTSPNNIKKFESLNSSFIKAAAYSPKTKEMVVKMNDRQGNAKYYKYENISSKNFDNFSKSTSKGQYFNKNIKGKYDYERIK